MIRDLGDERLVEEVLAAEVAVIYKHSPRCGSSLVAASHVERFAQDHPAVPVYRVDVVRHRALARALARRLEVPHASPQVLVLLRGRVAWSGSHGDVDAEKLAAGVLRAVPG